MMTREELIVMVVAQTLSILNITGFPCDALASVMLFYAI